MKLAFSSLAYPDLTLVDVVKRVSKLGYNALELRVADDGRHLRPSYPIREEDSAALREVEVSDLAAYARFSDNAAENERSMKLVEPLADIASALGAFGIRVYAGNTSDFDALAEALNSAGELAGSRSIKVMVETHGPLLDKVSNLAKLLPKLRGVWILYDPANVIFAGGKHEEVFPVIRDKLAHVHVKDYVLRGNDRFFCAPGQGVVPLATIMDDLKKSGYKGYVSVEWEKMWHPEIPDADSVLPGYRAYLKRWIG